MTDNAEPHEIPMFAAKSATARFCSCDDPDRAAFGLDGPVVPVNLEIVDDSSLSRSVLMPDAGDREDCPNDDNKGGDQGA